MGKRVELESLAKGAAGWTDRDMRWKSILALMKREYRRGYRAAKRRQSAQKDKHES